MEDIRSANKILFWKPEETTQKIPGTSNKEMGETFLMFITEKEQ